MQLIRIIYVISYTYDSRVLIQIGRNFYATTGYSPIYISSLMSLKLLYSKIIHVFIHMNLPFQELMQWLNWNWRSQWVYSRCNCNLYKVTLKVNICSVRVPSLPVWCRNLIIHSKLLCYYAVAFRQIAEQFHNHSFYSFQQRCYQRTQICSGMRWSKWGTK